MQLINTVYQHRVLARMTQEELARTVGVTRQTIISLEKGSYTPSALLALQIARAFGVTFEEVFSIEVGEAQK
jgi:putative transcriptional regulator